MDLVLPSAMPLSILRVLPRWFPRLSVPPAFRPLSDPREFITTVRSVKTRSETKVDPSAPGQRSQSSLGWRVQTPGLLRLPGPARTTTLAAVPTALHLRWPVDYLRPWDLHHRRPHLTLSSTRAHPGAVHPHQWLADALWDLRLHIRQALAQFRARTAFRCHRRRGLRRPVSTLSRVTLVRTACLVWGPRRRRCSTSSSRSHPMCSSVARHLSLHALRL